MRTPQPGIYALGGRAHQHLEFDLVGDPDAARAALVELGESVTSVAGVNLVVGVGAACWRALAPEGCPTDLVAFESITGPDGFTHPAAQHDLWVWLHGTGADAVFDAARSTVRALDGVADLVADQSSFTYGASQDLTGFEDGTENPPLGEAVSVATIADGPGAGGSIVLLQRWVHDLAAFDALDPDEQERVFGRTRVGSVELEGDARSPRAHIERVVIEDDDGEELEVWRRSTAFGTVREHGLVFLAFSADRDRLERMLHRMAGVDDGVRDRLTDFSTPTASAWYFTPPVELLR